jgi:hypothetical protein
MAAVGRRQLPWSVGYGLASFSKLLPNKNYFSTQNTSLISPIDGARMIILSPALGIRTKIDMLEVCKTICYRAIPYHLYWFGITMPNPPAY